MNATDIIFDEMLNKNHVSLKTTLHFFKSFTSMNNYFLCSLNAYTPAAKANIRTLGLD